jgi:hypothetical protein
VSVIVVEHRDRFARFGAEYVEAALSAQGRRLVVDAPRPRHRRSVVFSRALQTAVSGWAKSVKSGSP